MLTRPAAHASLPPWLTTVLGAAGTIVAVWGLHAGAALLGPVPPAFVLTVVGIRYRAGWQAEARHAGWCGVLGGDAPPAPDPAAAPDGCGRR